MAKSKTHLFDDKTVRAARVAKALAHPARVAILKLLSKRNACVCGEIVDGLPLAQATVSQHLKELKDAGIIKGTIDGPKSCYCIDWKSVEAFAALFDSFFVEISENHKRCC